jgi:iron complex outermembrane receptor protein
MFSSRYYRLTLTTLALVFVLVNAELLLEAQATISIRGTIVDASGGAIEGCAVRLNGPNGITQQQAISNARGEFNFDGLAPGRYEVQVEKSSFTTAQVPLDLRVGIAPPPLRVTLELAGISTEITVGPPKVDERPTGQLLTVLDDSIVRNTAGFSVGEVIGYSPGVSMQQGNGPRDVVISIRGSNTRSTFGIRGVQVFDDGFIVTQPDGLSRSDLNDPHAYGGVDVERGPSSSLYGNYAAEGAINFHTRRPEDINGLEGGLDAGSYGYRNLYLTYGRKFDNFEIMAFGSEVVGKGFTQHTSYNTTTANLLATFQPSSKDKFTFKFIDNEMYPNLSIRLSLNQFALNPYQRGCGDLSAAGCASVSVFVNGSTGTKVNLSADQAGLQRHDRRTIVGTRWEHFLNDRTVWRTQFMFDAKDIKQPTGATAAYGLTPALNLLSDVTQKGTLFGRPAVHFAGISANFENTNSQTYNVAPGGNATLGVLTAAAYGHAANVGVRAREEVQFTPKITGTIGFGVERSELLGRNNTYTYSSTAAPSIARVDAIRHYTNVAPEATLVVRPNRTIRLQTRVGTAYTTPQASNLFVTPAGVSGNNTQLKPQTNTGIDAGVDITRGVFNLNAAAYYEWYRNELLTQSPGVNLLSYTFNAPLAIHKGLESTFEVRAPGNVMNGLRLQGSYTRLVEYYDSYIETLTAGAFSQAFDRHGKYIPGITPHTLTSRIAYDRPTGELSGFGSYLEYSYRDKFWLDNSNLIQAPGYNVWNFNVHYDGRPSNSALRGFHLLFEIQNLTNRIWVASASNLSNSLNSSTGVQSDAIVLSNSGSLYAGNPRTFIVSLRRVF